VKTIFLNSETPVVKHRNRKPESPKGIWPTDRKNWTDRKPALNLLLHLHLDRSWPWCVLPATCWWWPSLQGDLSLGSHWIHLTMHLAHNTWPYPRLSCCSFAGK
jgi:hypothetical protein